MSDKARFWDKTADKYSRQPISNQKAYDLKLELTREYFTPESKVLEFGCGTGSTALLHAPYVDQIDAIDVSPRMIEIAKAKLAPAGIDNVNFEVADMDGYQADPDSYDAVLGLNILHLLDDRMAAIEEVYRVLKPGGLFVSSTFCSREKIMFRLMEPLFVLMHVLKQWPHLRRFTVKQLEADIQSVGFQTVHFWQPDNSSVLFLIGRKPA
ncbi:MAG: class I SAM-dependent methyltransferase [Pseudomonadota bacterium]